MAWLPDPVPDVAWVPRGEGAVVYVPSSGEVHVLNGPAALVWAACLAGVDDGELVAGIADRSGLERTELAVDVLLCVAQFRKLGLVADEPAAPAPVGVADPRAGWRRAVARPVPVGQVRLAVFDEVVQVELEVDAIQEAIEERFEDLLTDAEPTLSAAVRVRDDGWFEVSGPRPGVRSYPDARALVEGLPAELDLVAGTWTKGLVLHAGGVVPADGRTVVVAGTVESGTSTLVASLVQRGADFVADAVVGFTPDGAVVGHPAALDIDDDAGRLAHEGHAQIPARALRAEAKTHRFATAVDAVVFPVLDGSTPRLEEVVDGDERLVLLAEAARNLAVSGAAGLAALVLLADATPTYRVHLGDPAAAATLVENLGNSSA